jgi:spermidine synthase
VRTGTPPPNDPSFAVITAAGFAATVAQVLLLRELLVLFHGNEMSAGLALAGWLLWTAGGSAVAARLTGRAAPRARTLAALLSLQAATLPALVLVVRGARQLFGIPAGELPSIGAMVVIPLIVPALFCPIAGALFGLCWAFRRADVVAGIDPARTRPLKVYLGEALGAGCGGIAFYFVLLRFASALQAAVVVALLLLVLAGWVLRPRRPADLARPATVAWFVVTVAVLILAALPGRLEEMSRRWQWGERLAAARDSPFHNIAVLHHTDQVTVFTNGLWLFTLPDPATTELAVDVALLQHPEPRRLLLLGGGLAGHVEEALKHPSVESIDYVELDPELISFTEEFLTGPVRDSLRDPRVRIHRDDAGSFLRRRFGSYDVVLMSVGDPINAQMNRFYTVELFRRILRQLRPGGILTFSVPGGGDVVGPAHARLLASTDRTLREAFGQVAVVPGERARFLAARQTEPLVLDPAVLSSRIRERGLDLVHVRRDTLEDALGPFRLEYLAAILAEHEDAPINREFSPVCYLHGLVLWSKQWHPGVERLIDAAAAVRPARLWSGFAAIGALVTLFFWTGRPRYRAAVGVAVLAQGATMMVVQVVLILGFQILAGFAYLQLALIIAMFMAGLAVGTLWIAAMRRSWADGRRTTRAFAVAQAGVVTAPLLLVGLFSPALETLRDALSPAAASWTFSAASFVAGVLGGAHFSLAALAATAAGALLGRTGGYLYAVDLAGAAAGAFAAGLFLLPLYGVSRSLLLMSAISTVCLVALLRGPGKIERSG